VSARKAAAYVHVAGRVFAPGDEVPDEYAEKITNPAAWGEQDEEPAKAKDSSESSGGGKAPARRRTSKE
jgi:hypothetical protein